MIDPYSKSTTIAFWTDEYIAKNMLKAHLDPNKDAASRNHKTIKKTVDFIIEGVEEYTGITIISNQSEKIRLMITESLGRGVTVYAGKGGFGKKGADLSNFDILYTIVTRLEIAKIKTEIDKIDKDAFIIMNSIKDTKGGMIKKRPLK